MKIIKRGDPPKLEKEITCRNCKSELKYLATDVEYDQRENDSWIVCPVCKASISVKGK